MQTNKTMEEKRWKRREKKKIILLTSPPFPTHTQPNQWSQLGHISENAANATTAGNENYTEKRNTIGNR